MAELEVHFKALIEAGIGSGVSSPDLRGGIICLCSSCLNMDIKMNLLHSSYVLSPPNTGVNPSNTVIYRDLMP